MYLSPRQESVKSPVRGPDDKLLSLGRLAHVESNEFERIRERLVWIAENRFAGNKKRFSLKAGLAQSHAGQIIRGTVGEEVSSKVLRKLAAAGGVRYEWLVDGVEPRDAPLTVEESAGLSYEQVAAIEWARASDSPEAVIDELKRPRKGLDTFDAWVSLAQVLRAEHGATQHRESVPLTAADLPAPRRGKRKRDDTPGGGRERESSIPEPQSEIRVSSKTPRPQIDTDTLPRVQRTPRKKSGNG
jgi:hypothetical protein